MKRSGAIDGLRVLGIISIVAGHTWDNEWIRVGIYTWHVPLFFFLTGYLWSPDRTVVSEAIKRARVLLIPYLVWMVLIGAPFVVRLATKGEFNGAVIVNILLGGNHIGRPFSAFWFVTALFAVSVMLRAAQHLPGWVPWLAAATGMLAAYTIPVILAAVPFSLGVALPSLAFVLLGKALKEIRSRLSADVSVGLGLMAGGTVLAVTGAAKPFDIKQADFGTPFLSVLMACMLCAGALILAERVFARISVTANGIVTSLALVGFMVVLTHGVPLWLLGVGPAGSWVGFGAALVVPWAAALLLHRTPWAPFLCGTSGPTRYALSRRW